MRESLHAKKEIPTEVKIFVSEGDSNFKKLESTDIRYIHPSFRRIHLPQGEHIGLGLHNETAPGPNTYKTYYIPINVARKFPWFQDFDTGEYGDYGHGAQWRLIRRSADSTNSSRTYSKHTPRIEDQDSEVSEISSGAAKPQETMGPTSAVEDAEKFMKRCLATLLSPSSTVAEKQGIRHYLRTLTSSMPPKFFHNKLGAQLWVAANYDRDGAEMPDGIGMTITEIGAFAEELTKAARQSS